MVEALGVVTVVVLVSLVFVALSGSWCESACDYWIICCWSLGLRVGYATGIALMLATGGLSASLFFMFLFAFMFDFVIIF